MTGGPVNNAISLSVQTHTQEAGRRARLPGRIILPAK
jgi:hypothetical protein